MHQLQKIDSSLACWCSCQSFVDAHWLVKEDFVFTKHDVSDETVSVENVKDNIL